MEAETIAAKRRDQVGSHDSKNLRKEGYLPAVLYGHGEESIPLAVQLSVLEYCLKRNVRVLKIDMGDAVDQAMVKDAQWDALGDRLLHIDLLRVRMDEVVSMNVRIEPVGRAKGVEEGGILETQRTEVQVSCLPSNIPEVIQFDVSGLGLNESVHAKDLELPEGVTLEEEPDQVLVSIVTKVEAVEEEAPAEEVEEGEEEAKEASAEGEEKKEDSDDA
jgi:large subunit ribosomal protein L25